MRFLKYVFGPKLYMEYGIRSPQNIYEPSGMERIGDQILSTLYMMWNVGYYSSPFIITYLYRRGYFVADSISSFIKITTSIGVIVVLSLCLRGLGRSQSPSYNKLLRAMDLAKNSKKFDDTEADYRNFDFDFRHWQIDFVVKSLPNADKKKNLPTDVNTGSRLTRFSMLPCEILAYLAIHSFGIRMIYPGSVKLLQNYMRSMLLSGRTKLIEEDKGKRYKIKTVDDNEIDTVFVDNRLNSTNGRTLVICSEGNAGFYEIGIMSTPLSLKYSVLGWNHPGFECSTGTPFPDQDKNAINGIIQFAINGLGFPLEDIILYGWSIGGYTTFWAATNYPEVKGIILDATFDDVLHLAQSKMSRSIASIVKIAIRNYCNLNNLDMISSYHGPILLIRRTEDEIIAENGRIDTNRGNFLGLALLKYRYPNIFGTTQLVLMKNMLSKPLETRNSTTRNNICLARLITYASDKGKQFPMAIGEDYTDEIRTEMAEYLLHKHFRDYKSTHCTPLPSDYFNIPWDVPVENGFVFT